MANGLISKRGFQENKARQISQKTNISYPLIHTCAYQGVTNVRISENLACFVFLKHPFWDLPFCLITDKLFSQKVPSWMADQIVDSPPMNIFFLFVIGSDVNLLRKTFCMFTHARKSVCQCEDGFSNKRCWYWRIRDHSMLWIDQTFKNQGILNAKKGDLQYSKFNTLLWLLIFLNRDSLHARRNKH